jgi:uncharacterized protein (DUF885 family)
MRPRDPASSVFVASICAIRGFHDRVLEDGSVPLTFRVGKIRNWAGGGP